MIGLMIFQWQVLRDRVVRHVGTVLRRQHDRVYSDRPIAVVLDGDLGLPVRPQIRKHAFAPRLGQAAHEFVRQHDWQRHQFRGLGAGKAEHQALVARAAGVHALTDVARLLMNGRQDEHVSASKPYLPQVIPTSVMTSRTIF
jgi:hypothetical protein